MDEPNVTGTFLRNDFWGILYSKDLECRTQVIQAVTGMVDWKKQFMEAGGVAAFKPLSLDFTGISTKISVGYHVLLKLFNRTKNRSFSNQKSAVATLLVVRREQFTFSILDLFQNLLELMLFRCVFEKFPGPLA